MELSDFIRTVCRELQEACDREAEVTWEIHGHSIQYGGNRILLDLPVTPDDSGTGVIVAEGLHGTAGRIKFALTVLGRRGDGPTHRQAEANAADG